MIMTIYCPQVHVHVHVQLRQYTNIHVHVQLRQYTCTCTSTVQGDTVCVEVFFANN